MLKRKYVGFILSLAIVSVLAGSLLYYGMVWAQGVGEYSPWADMNDDGKIDMRDVYVVARKFGTSGEPITKAAIAYDSGWINITDKRGQDIIIIHNLNITDWSSADVMVDIVGKKTLDGDLLRYPGLTDYKQGWNKTYGGTYDDWRACAVQTADQGYALTGYSRSFGAGDFDAWLVKTDANGNAQWNKTYGGTSDDRAFSLVQTVDGGYALAGYTMSFGAGLTDAWLVKIDANGIAQWNKTYGTGYSDDAICVVQTDEGGYALAGLTYSYGSGLCDFWLVKTDANGIAQWNKTYGGASDDRAFSLVQTVDGGYALTGWTYSFGAGESDAWLVKTDTNGNAQWNKTYGGIDFDEVWSVIQTVDGGYALAGTAESFGAGGDDFWLVKTDANGIAQWNKTYGTAYVDEAYCVVQTVDGGYALAGYTESFGGHGDFWLVKTDTNGNAKWNKTYGGTSRDWAFSVVQTVDGGYALAGYTMSFGAGGLDFWLVKTDVFWMWSGLAWTDSSADTITLYRGTTDPYWNYVRVRIWKIKETP